VGKYILLFPDVIDFQTLPAIALAQARRAGLNVQFSSNYIP